MRLGLIKSNLHSPIELVLIAKWLVLKLGFIMKTETPPQLLKDNKVMVHTPMH